MPATLYMWNAHEGVPPGSGFAALVSRNSRLLVAFDTSTEEHYRFHGRIPLNASLGSGIKVRITWMAATATSGVVRWGAKWERGTTDADSDSFDTATEAQTTTSGTSGIAVTTEITCTNIDSVAAGETFVLDIYRDTGDAADTMSGDAQIVAVEIQEAA